MEEQNNEEGGRYAAIGSKKLKTAHVAKEDEAQNSGRGYVNPREQKKSSNSAIDYPSGSTGRLSTGVGKEMQLQDHSPWYHEEYNQAPPNERISPGHSLQRYHTAPAISSPTPLFQGYLPTLDTSSNFPLTHAIPAMFSREGDDSSNSPEKHSVKFNQQQVPKKDVLAELHQAPLHTSATYPAGGILCKQ